MNSMHALLMAALLLSGALAVQAEESKDGTASAPITTVASLMQKDLAGIEGKEATMITVDYAPGASSPPHRHDAHVFVYVLEGSIVMQVDGHDPVTLRSGETFYESPADVHRKSANASQTEHAKFLVLM